MNKVIRLVTYEPLCITIDDYEKMQREVRGRILAGDYGISDRVCLKLLQEHYGRYLEILDAQKEVPT